MMGNTGQQNYLLNHHDIYLNYSPFPCSPTACLAAKLAMKWKVKPRRDLGWGDQFLSLQWGEQS